MEMDQDLLGEDNELSRIHFLTNRDPMLPILPSPEEIEEILADDTPIWTPTPMCSASLTSPHPFLSDNRLSENPPCSEIENNLETVHQPQLDLTPPEPKTEDTLPVEVKPTRKRCSSSRIGVDPPRKRKRDSVATLLENKEKDISRPPTPIRPSPVEQTVEEPQIRPVFIVRPLFLPTGLRQDEWQPLSLLRIVPCPSPTLMHRLTQLRKTLTEPSDGHMSSD